jgi:hypothetical protein
LLENRRNHKRRGFARSHDSFHPSRSIIQPNLTVRSPSYRNRHIDRKSFRDHRKQFFADPWQTRKFCAKILTHSLGSSRAVLRSLIEKPNKRLKRTFQPFILECSDLPNNLINFTNFTRCNCRLCPSRLVTCHLPRFKVMSSNAHRTGQLPGHFKLAFRDDVSHTEVLR